MDGASLLKAIERMLLEERGTKTITATALAKELGVTTVTLSKWRNREEFTPKQVAALIQKRTEIVRKSAQSQAIIPIVEFLEIYRTESKTWGQMGDF